MSKHRTRTVYRDSLTGRFAKKSTWTRSRAQGGERYKRTRIKGGERYKRTRIKLPISRKERERAVEKEREEEKIEEITGAFDSS